MRVDGDGAAALVGAVVMRGRGQMERDHGEVHQGDDHPGPLSAVTPEFARAVEARRDHRRQHACRDRVRRVAQHRGV